jgi:UDP-glucose 4-epimerase
MKALVTGGTGFLGRAVVSELLKLGYEVSSYDNDFRGSARLLPKDVRQIRGDIRDGKRLIRAAKSCDLLVHLAFINGTRHFYEVPHLVTEVGIRGIMNVYDAILRNSIGEFVLFSTSEVYQTPEIFPTPENVELRIPDILNPRYSYGGSKIASELVTTNLIAKEVNTWKIVRPHNIYGPQMGFEHVIPELFLKASNALSQSLTLQGDGKQTRSFCYITDFMNAFSLIVQKGAKNEIYNIGVTEEVTIIDLARTILKTVGRDMDVVLTAENSGETRRRSPDINKLMSLGFVPEINLANGLRKFYELQEFSQE